MKEREFHKKELGEIKQKYTMVLVKAAEEGKREPFREPSREKTIRRNFRKGRIVSSRNLCGCGAMK